MSSKRPLARAAVPVLVVLFASAFSPPAVAAVDTETCARAYEKAQTSRADTKLLDAKKELLVCAQDSCPAVLRRDCVTWLSQIESEIPAISVRATGADGCDRPDAEISVDGTVVPRAAEGRPVELNPGSHLVRATIGVGAEKRTAEQTAVVGAGERRRTVTIAFGNATACHAGGPHSAAPGVPRPETPESKPIPSSVFAFGAIGILSLGVGTGFAIAGWNQKGTLDDCKGACNQGDVDTMQRTFVIADVAVVLGLASLAVAGILYFTR